MLVANGITKSYDDLQILKGINLEIKEGEVVSIVGSSGAGKTTLLQILGTLDRPDGGEVILNDINPFNLSANKLSEFRNTQIGFIFQFHQLLPEFTAIENVAMPLLYPYTAYGNHFTRSDLFGTNLCVSIEHALFWAPLERFSTAARDLPTGHKLIPWVGGLVDNGPSYPAPHPTKEDCRALLQHARLRGAEGYYTWRYAGNENYIDDNEFRNDMYSNA